MDLTLKAAIAGILLGYAIGLILGWIAGRHSPATLNQMYIMSGIIMGVAVIGTIYL